MARLKEFGFDAFGVRIAIACPAELEDEVRTVLPPGTVTRRASRPRVRLRISPLPEGGWRMVEGVNLLVMEGASLPAVLTELGANIREQVALHAPERVFIHAGVVAIGGRALLLPGQSFAGKSTIVEALVRSNAAYMSDEYAVLDADGRVHAFAKPVHRRVARFYPDDQVSLTPGEFGTVADDGPLEVGLIASLEYRPGAPWEPRTLSKGQGALLLLDNAVAARTRSEEVLAAARAAVEHAAIIEGQRGEAAEAAELLIAEMRDLLHASESDAPEIPARKSSAS